MVSEECKNAETLIELLTKHQVTSLLREFSQKEDCELLDENRIEISARSELCSFVATDAF